MAQPYVGEIRIWGGTFAPVGWMMCDGTPLAISENETLFQLIGTTYGGDGESTFNVPDLRGRVPVHFGTGPGNTQFTMAEMAGVEEVTLSTQQMPVHNHAFIASTSAGDQVNAGGNLPANNQNIQIYINSQPDGNMNNGSIQPIGGSQPHENRVPYLGLSFIISLYGIFPSPT